MLANDVMQESKAPQKLFGRFMLPDTSEHPCQVSDITVTGATFLSDQVPEPGVAIVAYLEELGRVEVISGQAVTGGFMVDYAVKGARLEKLETRIKWLTQRQEGGHDERRHMRYEPHDNHTQITLSDGRVYSCEVLDISVSGAAIKVEVMPSLGSYIMIGKMRGRVVRYHETGIAIAFVKNLERTEVTAL